MKINRNKIQFYGYNVLYALVFLLLLAPWAYFDAENYTYSFLPRKIIFVLIGITVALTLLVQKWDWKRVALGVGALSFLGIHYKQNGYLESHYLLQFFYLEIAVLILMAPEEIKAKFSKYSHFIFYIVMIKTAFFRTGGYIHGGFLSSNLYATYIILFCFIEIYQRRFYNLIPAAILLYFTGSKAAYIAIAVLILGYALQTILQDRVKKIVTKFNFHFSWTLIVTTSLVYIGTIFIVTTDYYHNWLEYIEPQRKEITERNMIRYGLDITPENEKERIEDFLARQEFYKQKDPSLYNGPLISDVPTSLGLRINQYHYMYTHLPTYFFVGDTIGSQRQIFGHNPHSAVVDFISRLGVLYLILMLFFYRRLFTSMDMVICNLSLIPILAFQPYGFTIGHSLPILSLLYGLAQFAYKSRSENKI
jgi:hypothetical protein